MNVVITGAGKGIGFALAQRFLSDPQHRVWVCSRNTTAYDEQPVQRLAAVTMDLVTAEEAGIRRQVEIHLGTVDILIHNAGILLNKSFAELTTDDWRQMFEVNVFGAAKVSRALLPLLRKSSAAHIIHIGSMGGFQGSSKFPGLSAYSAAKAALANLTECMAEELKEDGIYVNCLALGAVNTEMLRNAFPGYAANLSAEQVAEFIYDFSIRGRAFFNGKILPVTASTP